MAFDLRLKIIRKPKHTRLKFDLKKQKDPNVLETFQAMVGGKFATLTTMSTIFNTAVTETTNKILGKHRQEKKSWISPDILDLLFCRHVQCVCVCVCE